MSYSVIIPESIEKYLLTLGNKERERIYDKLALLEANPRGLDSLKLKGMENQYRIRKGDYRIIYFIDDNEKIIVVTDIAHRKDIYKKR